MFPFRIRVCGPRGPHCHCRDRTSRSSSIHWSCSQETRAAETQSQAKGISAPLNLFPPTQTHAQLLLLISRETMWAKGRKRWLWSGVIFFSDWAAILMSLKEFLHCTQHVDSDSWSSELTYDARKTFFKAFFSTLFWVVLPGDAITPLCLQAYVGMSSNVWWTVATLFRKRGPSVLLNLFPLFYCSHF